jgi:hypothetical protein
MSRLELPPSQPLEALIALSWEVSSLTTCLPALAVASSRDGPSFQATVSESLSEVLVQVTTRSLEFGSKRASILCQSSCGVVMRDEQAEVAETDPGSPLAPQCRLQAILRIHLCLLGRAEDCVVEVGEGQSRPSKQKLCPRRPYPYPHLADSS